MNVFKILSKEDLQLLENININIYDKECIEDEIKQITQDIYKNGYMNTEITYAEAEKYRQIYERFKYLSRVDLEKVKKYTRKEFENDYYMSTVLMHGVVWNSPYRINNSRKERGKETLSKEEYKKIEERQKANSIKFEEYIKYLENKYGKDLDATDKYYSTMIKE